MALSKKSLRKYTSVRAIKSERKTNRKMWALITFISGVALVVSLFLLIFYSEKCLSEECFKTAMAKCQRATYTSEINNSVWEYNVKGIVKGDCQIAVKNLDITADPNIVASLKGKEMLCYLPLNLTAAGIMPEQKVEYCHGYLKEGIQDIIIERMHLYLVQNLVQINQSLTNVA